jgi:hypothetical protein
MKRPQQLTDDVARSASLLITMAAEMRARTCLVSSDDWPLPEGPQAGSEKAMFHNEDGETKV